MPMRQRAAASSRETSVPSNVIEPAEGAYAPASTFNSVVFPAPFGPTIPTASSEANVKSTSATATKLLNRLVIPAAESKAGFSGTASLRSLDTLSYTESASHRRESRSPRRC